MINKTSTDIAIERQIMVDENIRILPKIYESSNQIKNNRKKTSGRRIQIIKWYDWAARKDVCKKIIHKL